MLSVDLLLFTLGAVICALAQNMTMLAAGRAIVGFGLGGEISIAVTMLAEFCSARFRGTAAGLVNVGSGGFGNFLAPAFGIAVFALFSGPERWRWIFAVLVLTLGSNQVATGLALAIFGIGLSSLIGASFVGMIVPSFDSVFPDSLAGDPLWRVVFGYSPLVYFALLMVFAVGWFLNRTRAGLILRAVGENDLAPNWWRASAARAASSGLTRPSADVQARDQRRHLARRARARCGFASTR